MDDIVCFKMFCQLRSNIRGTGDHTGVVQPAVHSSAPEKGDPSAADAHPQRPFGQVLSGIGPSYGD